MSLPREKVRDDEPAEKKAREGTIIGGKYRVDRVLGEGGMGSVYAATHVLTRKRVAIKTMLARLAGDEAWVARFMREANAAGRIHHPNVVDIYDVGEDDGVPFLVMELLVGTPLSDLFHDGPLPAATAVDLMMPALRGIAAAHAEGIVHRDLKPENVFLLYDDEKAVVGAKVLDFGISKARREDEAISQLTRSGAVMGTPHYMSLEQIRGVKDVDLRTDVYSIGVILYEALTGSFPFEAETFPALAIEVATSQPRSMRDRVPEIDPQLEAVVMKAMARRREERFPDVPALAHALEPFGRAKFSDRVTHVRIDRRAQASKRELSSEAPTSVQAVASAPTLAAGAHTGLADNRSGEREVPLVTVPEGPGADRTRIAPEPPDSDPDALPASRRPPWALIAAIPIAGVLALAIAYVAWPSDPPPPSRPAPEPPAQVETPAPPEPRIEAPIVREEPVEEPPAAIEPPPPPPEPEVVRRPRVRRPVASEPRAPVEQPAREEEPQRRGGVRTGGVSPDEF